jgi:hypothetical protein
MAVLEHVKWNKLDRLVLVVHLGFLAIFGSAAYYVPQKNPYCRLWNPRLLKRLCLVQTQT